jgi:hypothetical protein
MSLDTTLAAAASRAAQEKWDDHQHHCPTCSRAMNRRRVEDLCPTGLRRRLERNQAATEYSRQRELDKQPAPNQEPLFTDTELGRE